jgi:hypothetical protein
LAKGGSAPPPPDPYSVANAQAAANQQTAAYQTQLNRYNVSNPFGSVTWSGALPSTTTTSGAAGTVNGGGVAAGGAPTSTTTGGNQTATTTYSPEVQAILDNYFKSASATPITLDPNDPSLTKVSLPDISQFTDYSNLPTVGTADSYYDKANGQIDNNQSDIDLARSLTNQAGGLSSAAMNGAQAALTKGLDYGSLGSMPTFDQDYVKQVSDAYYNNLASRLDPQYQQSEEKLRNQLANQGLTQGSDAFNQEMQNFLMGKNDAYDKASNDAITQGLGAATSMFNTQLAGRQEGVNEINNQYNMPLDALAKIAGNYGTYSGVLNNDLATQIAQRQAVASLANQYQQSAINNQQNALGTKMTELAGVEGGYNLQASDRARQIQEILAANQNNMGNSTNLLNQLSTINANLQPGGGGATTQVAQTPLAQSIYSSYQGEMNNYNAAQQANNSALQTGGSVIGAIAMAF